MNDITKEEAAWLRKIQRLLSNPPSDRLGFYTNGDPDVSVYDRTKEREIQEAHARSGEFGEFGNAVDECDARLGVLNFPGQVHSVSG